jgi:hypothetical protein
MVTRWQRFTHRFGWHRPLEPVEPEIGVAVRHSPGFGYYRCVQCGKIGLMDSQGNLF